MDRFRVVGPKNVPVLLIVMVALAGAACSSKGSTPSGSPQGGGATNTIEQGPNGQLIFSPSTISVKAGATLTIKNVGSVPHTFTVTGQGIDVTNDTGQTHQVTVNLPAGTYPFVCRFHEGSGMTGTLTVTG
jgi:plastocyanin